LFSKCFDPVCPEGLTFSDLTQQLKKKKTKPQQVFLFLGVTLKQIFILQIKIESDCLYLGKSQE